MTVQLFVTCLIDSLFPEVGEATVEVLRRAGESVAFPPGQTCCGQPAFNAGCWEEARRMARRTLQVLSAAPGPVVVPSGSCTHMMRHGYLELFREDPVWGPRARALAQRTFELSEFLVDVRGMTDTGASFAGPLAYHPACHLLRGLGVDRQPKALLQAIEGAELHELPPDCCGFGGVFAVEEEPISSEMLARRLAQIEACGAQRVVACDVSCLMHLEGGLRRAGSPVRCSHLAQVLAGREPGLR